METHIRKTVTPESKEHWLEMRSKLITSTDVAALFGISPYLTEFELWHRKANAESISIDENERMIWGTRLEKAIAEGVAQDNNWQVEPMKDFYIIEDLKLGSSFDFKIKSNSGEDEILEIKNVDSLAFRDGWEEDEDGDIQAPLWIEIQVQFQMLVSGINKAWICALVGGNKAVILKREADPEIFAMIKQKASAFWKSIKDEQAPKPDFMKDAEFITKLYSHVHVGKTLTTEDEDLLNLALEYKQEADLAKAAEERKQAVKAQILVRIGDIEKVKHSEFSISAGLIGEAEISYTRQAYRSFRINWPRSKK